MTTVPVTILTGFLGAGKTTLLNRILTASHGKRIAVVVNEFGDIGLDDKFIAKREGDIIELTNGCACCTARNDTLDVLMNLAARARQGEPMDHVIIETTGLAKPSSLARLFLADAPLAGYYELDGIVTVVDAFFGVSQMVQNPEVKEQIGVADLILLNKMDLAEAGPLENLTEWIAGINPSARIVQIQPGTVPLDEMLHVGGFDLRGKDHIIEERGHDVAHDSDIVSVSIREEQALDRGAFNHWLREYVAVNGGDLLRYKGILNFSEHDQRVILQGVHMIGEFEDGEPWGDTSRVSELVFIGRHLDEDVIRSGVRDAIAR